MYQWFVILQLFLEKTRFLEKQKTQVLNSKALAFLDYLNFRNYSHSTAACAAANECWLSMSYRVGVKHWLLFLDSFCLFCHAFGNKNVSFADNLFLCHIFYFLFYTKLLDLFYTKLLDLYLAIVNCFCFLSQKFGFITRSAFLLTKILKNNRD